MEINSQEMVEKVIRSAKDLGASSQDLKELLNACCVITEEYNRLQVSGKASYEDLDELLKACCVVTEAYEKLIANEEDGVVKGIVYSVRPLDADEMQRITDFASNKFNRKTTLINKIDKSLISGIKLEVGDQIIDGSLKSQLDDLRSSLLQ